MNIWTLFFGFKGRIGRAAYWLGSISVLVLDLFINSLVKLASLQAQAATSIPDPQARLSADLLWLVVLLVLLVILFFCIWAALAVPAKRWHDRNRSAWWVLVGLIPVVGWLWTFIECGCLPGTPGANQYGASSAPADVAATFWAAPLG